MMEPVKRMNLNVPVQLHNQFKAATAAEGKDMTTVLLQYIQQYVDKHPIGKPANKGRRG